MARGEREEGGEGWERQFVQGLLDHMEGFGFPAPLPLPPAKRVKSGGELWSEKGWDLRCSQAASGGCCGEYRLGAGIGARALGQMGLCHPSNSPRSW